MGADRATLGELRGACSPGLGVRRVPGVAGGLFGADPLAVCRGCSAYRGESASGEGLGRDRGDFPLDGQEECIARRVDEVGLEPRLGHAVEVGRWEPARVGDRMALNPGGARGSAGRWARARAPSSARTPRGRARACG